ncbi:MAG TPA: ornithine cyclodeaminase family protein [Gaiellales bacterium]|jgi:ornithine cyclodeaminase|nr:ornithine cyclodeaminase family protein [Gaiellales bacterium]
MSGLQLTYLSGDAIDRLDLPDERLLAAVESALAAQGRGEAVLEPRVHLFPDPEIEGHFNVLRGALPELGRAGVKVVGDYVHNHRLGLPSELALQLVMDTRTGAPLAVLDATAITAMRTGATTAVGARHLARQESRVLGHIGSRGSAYWNVRLLCHVLPGLEEVRIHSLRPESREALAARLASETGRDVRAVDGWEKAVRGADVVVEATRLQRPEPLLRTAWIAPGALVVPYGTMSAVELSLTDIMDKIVVDDWGQAGAGPLGALRAHVDSGRLTRESLHAEIGEIVCGARPGRETPGEICLFWHRGLSICDLSVALELLHIASVENLDRILAYRS